MKIFPRILILLVSTVALGCTKQRTQPTAEASSPADSGKESPPASPSKETTAASAKDAAEFKGATNDPDVMKFLAAHKTLGQVGDVRTIDDKTEQLWDGDRLVFEAIAIRGVRTKASDGTIVLSAVTKIPPPPAQGESWAKSELPSEVWLVDSRGAKKRVSPEGVNATGPLISADGNVVAFAGIRLNAGPIGEQLFVVNVKTAEVNVYGGRRHEENYTVWPVEWTDNNSAVNIIEDYGETGGHMVMKRISVR